MKKNKIHPEQITVKGVSVTIYSTPSFKDGKKYPAWTLSYTEAGKRIRRSVANLDKARTVARSIAGQLASGTGHAHALTPAELSDYQGAIRILRQAPGIHLTTAASTFAQAFAILPDAGDILTGVRFYQAHLKKQGVSAVAVSALVDEFLKAREQQGVSAPYLAGCKSILTRFSSAFRCNVAGIESSDLQDYVDRLPGSPITRANVKKTLVTLFHFAKKRGYLPREQSTEADHLDAITIPASPVGIYRPGDLAAALATSTGEAQLAVALGAFTGIRSAELHRLDWEDIGAEYVTVAPEKAKTAARRLVPILPPLAAFLALHRRGKGRVFSPAGPSKFSALITGAFRAAEVDPVNNGLRHSFCTYRLADIQNAAQVSLEAGNSPAKIFKHYRELATREQGAAWFNVRPVATAGNVINMTARAA